MFFVCFFLARKLPLRKTNKYKHKPLSPAFCLEQILMLLFNHLWQLCNNSCTCFFLFLLLCNQIHDTLMLFYTWTIYAWPLLMSFFKKTECKSIGWRSRCHFFEFATEKNVLFTDVPFYLAFGVANLFRDKNKLSQSLNIISYKTLLVKQSLDLTVVTSREVAKMVPLPSRICSFSVMTFHRHTLLPSKFLYFFPLSLRKWVLWSKGVWGVRGKKRGCVYVHVCVCFISSCEGYGFIKRWCLYKLLGLKWGW